MLRTHLLLRLPLLTERAEQHADTRLCAELTTLTPGFVQSCADHLPSAALIPTVGAASTSSRATLCAIG